YCAPPRLCSSPFSSRSLLPFSLRSPSPAHIYTFPYTTLFRSSLQASAMDPPSAPGMGNGMYRTHDVRSGRRDRLADLATGRSRRDRKSTRLNSSHVSISYAVFCLKKNKPHTPRRDSTQDCTRR